MAACTDRLRRVFDYGQIAGGIHDRLDRSHLSEEIYGDYGARRRLDVFRDRLA